MAAFAYKLVELIIQVLRMVVVITLHLAVEHRAIHTDAIAVFMILGGTVDVFLVAIAVLDVSAGVGDEGKGDLCSCNRTNDFCVRWFGQEITESLDMLTGHT